MSERWSRIINNVNLRKKLVISYLLVIFIPIMIVGVYLTSEFRRMSLDNAVRQTELNVEREKKRTEEVLDVPIDISGKLMMDVRLKEIAGTRYTSTLDVTRNYRDYHEFKNLLETYEEISQFRLYIDNPTLLNSWEIIPLDKQTTAKSWYKHALEANGRISWYDIHDPMQYKSSNLSMVRKLQFAGSNSYAVLVIDINTVFLNAILAQESFETMIIDENQNIVAANRESAAGSTLEDSRYGADFALLQSGAHDMEIDGESYKVIVEDFVFKHARRWVQFRLFAVLHG